MKKRNIEEFGCLPLEFDELTFCNGGKTPDAHTSFANDAAYYITYGAIALWDGFRAFGAGAAKGQRLRFAG